MPTVTEMSKTDLKILRVIADGSRTLAKIKTKMRKDQSAKVKALVKAGSVRKDAESGDYILTRKGAGQLRFAD